MITRRSLAALGFTALSAAALAVAPASPAQAYRYNWGALAYSYDGRTGYAVDYPSQSSAIRAAKGGCSECGYVTFYNSCGAIAYGNGVIGRASGYRTMRAADSAAIRQSRGGRVAVHACTTRPA